MCSLLSRIWLINSHPADLLLWLEQRVRSFLTASTITFIGYDWPTPGTVSVPNRISCVSLTDVNSNPCGQPHHYKSSKTEGLAHWPSGIARASKYIPGCLRPRSSAVLLSESKGIFKSCLGLYLEVFRLLDCDDGGIETRDKFCEPSARSRNPNNLWYKPQGTDHYSKDPFNWCHKNPWL